MMIWISWCVELRHWLKKERVLGRKQQRAVKGVRKLTRRINFCGVLEDCVLV